MRHVHGSLRRAGVHQVLHPLRPVGRGRGAGPRLEPVQLPVGGIRAPDVQELHHVRAVGRGVGGQLQEYRLGERLLARRQASRGNPALDVGLDIAATDPGFPERDQLVVAIQLLQRFLEGREPVSALDLGELPQVRQRRLVAAVLAEQVQAGGALRPGQVEPIELALQELHELRLAPGPDRALHVREQPRVVVARQLRQGGQDRLEFLEVDQRMEDLRARGVADAGRSTAWPTRTGRAPL